MINDFLLRKKIELSNKVLEMTEQIFIIKNMRNR